MGPGVAIKNLFGTGKDIYWYGIIIACALIIAIILGIVEARRKGYISDMIIDFMFLAVPLAIVGARLYYVIFEWDMFAGDPVSILYIWNGGLGIYGAVIGGVIAALIFCRWKKIPFGDLMDIAAPSLVLAQGIGRWGNFANQEAFGAKITDPAWQWFPAAVYIQRPVVDGILYPAGYYMATFFYESFWDVAVFVILMLYRKKAKFRGNVFAAYVMLYGFGRMIIEGLRTDSLYLIQWSSNVSVNDAIVFNGLRVSQVISLLLVIAGIVYFIMMRRKNPLQEAYYGKYSLDFTEDGIEEPADDATDAASEKAVSKKAGAVIADEGGEPGEADETEVKAVKKPRKRQLVVEDMIAEESGEEPEEKPEESKPKKPKAPKRQLVVEDMIAEDTEEPAPQAEKPKRTKKGKQGETEE
jgi:phosphatidylglycerol:prolipoprotein diacylglycerol transferase